MFYKIVPYFKPPFAVYLDLMKHSLTPIQAFAIFTEIKCIYKLKFFVNSFSNIHFYTNKILLCMFDTKV